MEQLRSYRTVPPRKFSSDQTDSFESDSIDSDSNSRNNSPVLGHQDWFNRSKLRTDESADSSDLTDDSNKRWFFIIPLLFILMGALAVQSFHYSQLNITNNCTGTNEIVPIDWWVQYTHNCCVFNNSTHWRGCELSNLCYIYLRNWLYELNQTFYNSKLTRSCCYDFRAIGDLSYNRYCSFVCLNSLRTLY